MTEEIKKKIHKLSYKQVQCGPGTGIYAGYSEAGYSDEFIDFYIKLSPDEKTYDVAKTAIEKTAYQKEDTLKILMNTPEKIVLALLDDKEFRQQAFEEYKTEPYVDAPACLDDIFNVNSGFTKDLFVLFFSEFDSESKSQKAIDLFDVSNYFEARSVSIVFYNELDIEAFVAKMKDQKSALEHVVECCGKRLNELRDKQLIMSLLGETNGREMFFSIDIICLYKLLDKDVLDKEIVEKMFILFDGKMGNDDPCSKGFYHYEKEKNIVKFYKIIPAKFVTDAMRVRYENIKKETGLTFLSKARVLVKHFPEILTVIFIIIYVNVFNVLGDFAVFHLWVICGFYLIVMKIGRAMVKKL